MIAALVRTPNFTPRQGIVIVQDSIFLGFVVKNFLLWQVLF